MAFIMRSFVCNKIVQAISGFPIGGRGLKSIEVLPYVRICQKTKKGFEYILEIKDKSGMTKDAQVPTQTLETLFNSKFGDPSDLIEKFQVDDIVSGVYLSKEVFPKVKLKVCPNKFIKEVLSHIYNKPETFWKSSSLLSLTPKQKIVVEFSSPNIAKPFHMGHLRSTIIGNFICNLHSALGHDVTRINYLGDWGTQFGLLKYGYDRCKMTAEDLKENAIRILYELYVSVNSESQESSEVREMAKEIFNSMEKGNLEHLRTWKLFRDLSIEHYKKVYGRLGVHFDEFHGESMYSISQCDDLVKLMKESCILESSIDGRKIYKCNHDSKQPDVTIVKSDGSTVYITRDISAAIHRFDKYQFDKMFYVVDNSQHYHFRSLKNILTSMGKCWAGQIEHVKFGRVQGMSTRKGTAVFLEDLLNEAQELMVLKQNESKNTVFDDPSSYRDVADIVGASAIIVADLKRKRMRNYSFSWQDALQSLGDTGVKLQYTHCRLVRLKENCGVSCVGEVDHTLLKEPEVENLVRTIARFDEILYDSAIVLESWMLANYLFELSTAINKALKVLPVKNSAAPVAEARLKLFEVARITLAAGMKILGLRPLQQM